MALTRENKMYAGLLGLLALAFLGFNSFFVVNPTEQAIVFQFRELVRTVQKPGIHFKLPVIQETMYFDRRVLPLEVPERNITLADQKPLNVDAFARWRIEDPLLFFQSLRDERNAASRLSSILNDSVQTTLRRYLLTDLLSTKRQEIMDVILTDMNKNTARMGVEVVDVRIRRADLPDNVLPNVFERMRSDRKLEATGLRSTGQKEASEIRAKAEAEAKIIVSKAQSDSSRLRGEGEREALKIVTDASNRDVSFFNFYRTLEAYRSTLNSSNTTYMLSPESDFFNLFRSGRVQP